MNNINNNNTKAFEIKDEELNLVNGGYCLIGATYDRPEDVAYRFDIGSHVELVTAYIWRAFTVGCTVIDRKIDKCQNGKGFCAWYKVSCSDDSYDNVWFPEKEFETGFGQCLTAI